MNSPALQKVLLIGFDYHDYTRSIVEELKLQGYEVTFHSIQPGKPYLKVLRKFAPSSYPSALDRYHAGIIECERANHYDLVLFIQVHQFMHANMQRLKASQKVARFILYNWDAVTTHDYTPYLGYFEQVYTFDPDDARKLQVQYLPLFCLRKFQGLTVRSKSPLSVYFIGNIVNPRRYLAVKKFKRYCCDNGIDFQYFLSTTTSGLTQMVREGHSPWDVSLRSISERRFLAMMESSNAVFDFANHFQSGQTMRIMENLCARKKIITNDQGIRGKSYCSSDRIHIFDGLDFNGVKEFLAQPLLAPDEVFSEFHIGSFVKRLVGIL